MLTDDQVAQYKRDGFLLVKGVLTPAEVTHYRDVGGTQHAELALLPELKNFWADPRVLSMTRRLLGESITYFGEGNYRGTLLVDETQTGGRLHHDAKGTLAHLFNRQHPPTPEPYPILSIGFYLQDHARFGGGLKVVPGSHQMDSSDIDLAKLSYYDIPSEPGDAVIFCLKTLHAAHAMRLKTGEALSPPEQALRYARDPDAFLHKSRDRRVIFVDFAGSTDLADIFIKNRALHPSNLKDGFADIAIGGAFMEAAERTGVRLRLDAAVVEAVTKIYASAPGGNVTDVTRHYAKGLPTLCRFSKSWSPHYDFIPDVPAEDTVEAGLALATQLAPRITALRKHMATARPDKAMGSISPKMSA
jgi:hypothetical protein